MNLFQISQAFAQFRDGGLPLGGALRVGSLYVTAGREKPIPSLFASSLATAGHTPNWEELRALVGAARALVPRTFLAGQPLCLRGERTDGLYVVHAGAVRINGGDEEHGPMNVHGAWAAFTQGPARHTVVATRPSILLRLDLDAADQLARACPAAARVLCQSHGRRAEPETGVG